MAKFEIDNFSDAELGRMVKQAAVGKEAALKEGSKFKDALKALLRLIGLPDLADAMEVADYVFQKLKSIINNIFSSSSDSKSGSWGWD
jgi:hypothetical protein